MRPLSNSANRDVETLLHPVTNLAAHRSLGPLVLERGEGVDRAAGEIGRAHV